jgi:tetratricopeptide (TPR) repeat protein
MQKTFILLFFTALATVSLAQSNYERFKKLYKENDTVKIKSLLDEWERTNPNDPELYTSAINFYYSNSKQESYSMDRERKGRQSLQFTDSTGNVAGYVNAYLGFNPDKLRKAINYANAGISKFPDRLDIRFGKCYVLQQIGDYENFTNELVNTIEYSRVNKNLWLWTENEKMQNGKGDMLETIQAYLKEIYDTGDDSLLPNMIKIGEAVLKYYDHSIEILSSTAVALLLTKNYDKAIGYLHQAEKLNPKDFIVLNNLARGYKLMGDKPNAIKYYELTEKYGDEQAKQQARKNIEDLKKH